MSYVTNPLQTVPPSITFGGGEAWTFGIDTTVGLSDYPTGTTPTDPVVVLESTRGPSPITLPDQPTVDGMVVSQRIPLSVVSPGITYQATLTVTPSDTSDVREFILLVTVPGNS